MTGMSLRQLRCARMNRAQVNYFSTPAQNIENFKDSTELERKIRLAQAHFRKTWFHREGQTIPSVSLRPIPSCVGRAIRGQGAQ